MQWGIGSLKPREARRQVSLSARIRAGGLWSDARIRNVSSRGLLIEGATAFDRGEIIEIRRGPVRIIARIVWADGERFGLRSQDRICIESLIKAENSQARVAADGTLVERRATARKEFAVDHEDSRAKARIFQFVSLVGLTGAGGSMIALLLWEILHSATGAISAAMS